MIRYYYQIFDTKKNEVIITLLKNDFKNIFYKKYIDLLKNKNRYKLLVY